MRSVLGALMIIVSAVVVLVVLFALSAGNEMAREVSSALVKMFR